MPHSSPALIFPNTDPSETPSTQPCLHHDRPTMPICFLQLANVFVVVVVESSPHGIQISLRMKVPPPGLLCHSGLHGRLSLINRESFHSINIASVPSLDPEGTYCLTLPIWHVLCLVAPVTLLGFAPFGNCPICLGFPSLWGVRSGFLTFIERVIMKRCWAWSCVSLLTMGCEILDRALASGSLIPRAWRCCRGYY